MKESKDSYLKSKKVKVQHDSNQKEVETMIKPSKMETKTNCKKG